MNCFIKADPPLTTPGVCYSSSNARVKRTRYVRRAVVRRVKRAGCAGCVGCVVRV